VVVNHVWKRRRELAVVMWGGTSITLTVAVGWATLAPTESDWNLCGIPPARFGPLLPQAVVVAGTLVAFVLGHLSGRMDPAPPPRVQRTELAERLGRSRTRVQTIVVGLLMLMCVGLLAYETFALQNPHSYVAITYYVRCANVIHNYRTFAAALLLCFLIGRWFRFPGWSAS
jgi:hypothetical protein